MNTKNMDNVSNTDLSRDKEQSAVKSWIIVLAIAVFFFLWGLSIYVAVGDNWPPPWRYGTVEDVPGQSVYSVSKAEGRAGAAPSEGRRTREQHVMGNKEGSVRTQGQEGS